MRGWNLQIEQCLQVSSMMNEKKKKKNHKAPTKACQNLSDKEKILKAAREKLGNQDGTRLLNCNIESYKIME